MPYTKQNFQDGKTLTAAQLNHIEDGIEEIEASLPVKIQENVSAAVPGIVSDVLAALPTWNGGSY